MRTSRRTLAAFAVALVALSGEWDKPRGASHCAERLGISWSAEDGATERLDTFRRCVSVHT